MADGPIWWPKPPGRPTGSPAPYWNLELGTWNRYIEPAAFYASNVNKITFLTDEEDTFSTASSGPGPLTDVGQRHAVLGLVRARCRF